MLRCVAANSNRDKIPWVVPFAVPKGTGYVLCQPPTLIPDSSIYCGLTLLAMSEHSRSAEKRRKTVADRYKPPHAVCTRLTPTHPCEFVLFL